MSAQQDKSFQRLFMAMCFQNYDLGSRFYAKPTYVVSPGSFYIMPYTFIYDVAALSRPGNPLQTEDLKTDRTVIFKSENSDVNKYFQEDNWDEYIRGMIQNVNDDKCQIYALDRGFIEKDVPVDRVFEPACKEAISTSSLIRHCELYSCSPFARKFDLDTIEAFKLNLGNEKLSVVVRGKSYDKLKVAIYNSNLDDVASLLALTN